MKTENYILNSSEFIPHWFEDVQASEDIIHSKLSTYKELDNMSRKDTRRNNQTGRL